MTTKQVDLVTRVSVNLVFLVVGWVALYILCWLFESGVDGHAVTRWSDARCGFSILGALLCWLFKRQADGERP